MEDRIETLAAKLLRSPDSGVDTIEAARKAARRMLEDSEARTTDPAAHDHEHDGAIRRTSNETASVGDTGVTRREHDGD